MPRYKEAERAQMRDEARRRLLAAAVDEFAREGYERANINRISQAAGFAQGTVYNYYPSKRGLFEAVVSDIARRHCDLVLQAAASAAQPAQRLERFLAAGFAFVQGYPAAAGIVIPALYGTDSVARDLVRRAYAPLYHYVEQEIVQAAVLDGQFRLVDTGVATALILAVYLGGCSPNEESAPLRANARTLAGLVLEGLRGDQSR